MDKDSNNHKNDRYERSFLTYTLNGKDKWLVISKRELNIVYH